MSSLFSSHTHTVRNNVKQEPAWLRGSDDRAGCPDRGGPRGAGATARRAVPRRHSLTALAAHQGGARTRVVQRHRHRRERKLPRAHCLAILLATQEPRGAGQAHPRKHVRWPSRIGKEVLTNYLSQSIRFSPPLVISEGDLQNAIGVIRQALVDLDQVRGILPTTRQTGLLMRSSFRFRSSRRFLARWRARRVSGTKSVTEGTPHPVSCSCSCIFRVVMLPT